MPHAGYKNFKDCVKKNQDKRNLVRYCGKIWETEKKEKSR